MEKGSRWKERKNNNEGLLKVEKAAAGEKCTCAVTGLLGGPAGAPQAGACLPLASDLSHADKAHADSGRQNWAKRLEYTCH